MTATAPQATKPELQRQYIATAGFARGARRLPDIAANAIGDVRFNHSVFEQISCDPEAAAALLLLVIFVLADDVQLSPAISAPADGQTDPQYQRALDVKDHIERTVCGLDRTLKETLEMIIRPAMIYGNKVAEKVYEIPTDGLDAFKLVLKSIKVLKRGSTSYVVDEFMNLLGLAPSSGIVAGKLTDQTTIIPTEKFIIASFRAEDEDPRGTSIFRAVVKPWHIKQLSWPEFLAYLMRWAMPSIAAILSESANDETQYEADGVTPKVDPNTGQAVTITAAQTVVNALEAFKNSSVAAFEHGTELTPIEATGEGQVFETAFQILNSQIRKAILLQELATADAQHQTKGSTSEQMDVISLLVWSIKCWVSEAIIRRQIVYPQVLYNFGEQAARELCPKVSLGDYERKDWATDSTAVVALITATVLDENGNKINALTPSQIQSLLTQIGIAPPTEAEIEAIRAGAEARRQKQEQQQNQPPAQQPPAPPQQEKKAA